jgi:hypothetical protein
MHLVSQTAPKISHCQQGAGIVSLRQIQKDVITFEIPAMKGWEHGIRHLNKWFWSQH